VGGGSGAGLPTCWRGGRLEGSSVAAAAAELWPVLAASNAALPATHEGEDAVAATSERPARNGPRVRVGTEDRREDRLAPAEKELLRCRGRRKLPPARELSGVAPAVGSVLSVSGVGRMVLRHFSRCSGVISIGQGLGKESPSVPVLFKKLMKFLLFGFFQWKEFML
jgi:hypothetical protein